MQNYLGHLPLPGHFPLEEEIIFESEEDTTGIKCIGKKVTDQLELVPAKLIRNFSSYQRTDVRKVVGR